jgi:hypothetical protein
MIIGVDRSGRENDLPIVYAAVRGEARQFLAHLEKEFPKFKSIKSKFMKAEELKRAYGLYHGEKSISCTLAKEYDNFRRSDGNHAKWKQKLAGFKYFEAVIPIVRDGDTVFICPDFAVEDMEQICGYVEDRINREFKGVTVRIGDKSKSEIKAADIIAGAYRKNKMYRSRVRSHQEQLEERTS